MDKKYCFELTQKRKLKVWWFSHDNYRGEETEAYAVKTSYYFTHSNNCYKMQINEALDTFIVFLKYLLFSRISFYVTDEVSQLSGVTDFPVKLGLIQV